MSTSLLSSVLLYTKLYPDRQEKPHILTDKRSQGKADKVSCAKCPLKTHCRMEDIYFKKVYYTDSIFFPVVG